MQSVVCTEQTNKNHNDKKHADYKIPRMWIQEDVEQLQVFRQVGREPKRPPVHHGHLEEDRPHKQYAKISKTTGVFL